MAIGSIRVSDFIKDDDSPVKTGDIIANNVISLLRNDYCDRVDIDVSCCFPPSLFWNAFLNKLRQNGVTKDQFIVYGHQTKLGANIYTRSFDAIYI